MEIERLRLENFKCYADSGTIPLAPLTIVFGRNNTGKSSILQSLLLLRQTLDSPEYGPRLDLRGALYPAGSYADIVHQHQSREPIRMAFGLSMDKSRAANLELEFCADEPQPPRLARLHVEPPDCEPLEIRRARGNGGLYELHIGGVRAGTEEDAVFRFPESGFFPLIGPEPPRAGRPNQRRSAARDAGREVLSGFEGVLRGMRAVGAFRRQPARRYEYQGTPAQSIDAMGQAVVDALIDDSTKRGKKRGELVDGVNRWLRSVGNVKILPLKRISRSARIFELRLRDTDSGRWANFADVGFGVGQAFPVLVEGLRTPPGGMFLVQEPEIHLHPDAQLRMADFLISLATSGRRVVAETHSENLLLRVRRRIAAGKRSRLAIEPKDVSVVYVEKSKEGTSRVVPLELDEMAQVRNWPTGFMEEATQERIEILSLLGRRVARGFES